MPINDIALGYCIGIFEGEGCISYSETFRRGRVSRRIIISIGMTDLYPLQMFQEVMDAGNLNGPYQRNSEHKPMYRLEIAKIKDIRRITDLMYDWLSPRRKEQIDTCLTNYGNWDQKPNIYNDKLRVSLSQEQIKQVQEMYKKGYNKWDKGNAEELAVLFNVSRATICNIASRRGRYE